MRRSLYRPFEIIKLIRDGVIRNVRDLRIPDSRFHILIREFEAKVTQLGLIEVDDSGNVRTTARWEELASGLKLSLSQLSAYDENSVICAPTFGLPARPAVEAEVFILMPFTNDIRPVYEDHIKGVLTRLGLTVARADDFFTADSIVSDIWNAINACRIIIADCTARNPNVFYEIGIAHTLGKPVILIAQSTDDIPFDVKHLGAIVYEFTPRGMQKLEAALDSTLEHELRMPTSLEGFIRSYREQLDG